MYNKDYKNFITEIKQNILASRYIAAKLANKELLLLYLRIGKMIHLKINKATWGTKILDKISIDLQHELPGLRGFSSQNLKKMRVFFNGWKEYLQIGSALPNQFEDNYPIQIGSALPNHFVNFFLSLSFTHHYLIISKVKPLHERIFYIYETSSNFWSTRVLEKHLKEQLFQQKGKLPNNFEYALPEKISNKAIRMFKNEYLWGFIKTEDEDDERQVERAIVQNIKNFLMSLGNDFTFIGNQYRLIVEGDELFIDLLFFHRKLQCLVAFELKTGKFKAEYVGKMNLYLSALDEYVKQPQEKPSIGIILCKEKKDKYVEFAFRDFNKPMGVASYKTSKEIPEKYKEVLPDIEILKKII